MNKVLLFTCVFFLAFVHNSFAHTGLESSSPQNGEVIKEKLNQIALTFETKIEQGSTFELINSVGNTFDVEEIVINENTMVGQLANPLENGQYHVNWDIIGADGHPIEGEFSFAVQLPITETNADEQVNPEEETQTPANDEETQKDIVKDPEKETQEDTVNEETESETESTEKPSNIIPILIGLLIILVVGSFIIILKRKK
ncbi:copper resistance CopC family protein [Bacillus sp. Marseille-P3661]|uniref:copper resistance CopC family protein n=1 Tax=Bacillus sp. Marseille-P3661 TaxID=1936234 RepID=UPI000C861FCE|nr:copper resistance CopC family protein [Bacillus sp. Marseille-P3661]